MPSAQPALWLAVGTIALAVVAFVYFALLSKRLSLNPFFFRGRLLIVAGVGLCGLGLYLTVRHHTLNTGHGVSFVAIMTMVSGVMLWIIGEIWDRRARKNVKWRVGLIDIAREARAKMEHDGEESSPK